MEDTYYSRNREKRLEYQKKHYNKNRESKIDYQLRKEKEYRRERPEIYLLKSARQSAKRRGYEFTITKDDIVIPEYCPLLGLKLTNDRGMGRSDCTMSLDRIDSNKGYIPGNVWVISLLANRMKHNATKEQLITFAENIINMYG